jgi:RNA polymerase sigma factor (sigma-70 family)
VLAAPENNSEPGSHSYDFDARVIQGSKFPGEVRLKLDDRQAFVSAVATEHGARLRRFFQARLHHAAADIPDLMQEIFLRLMRLNNPETIRTPEAYLYTVAKAVLHQHRAQKNAEPEAVDIMDVLAELEENSCFGPEARLHAQQRLAEFNYSLEQLPRKACATLILNRVAGMTLEEVGERLGISRAMAKKYLAKALAHCRPRNVEGG